MKFCQKSGIDSIISWNFTTDINFCALKTEMILKYVGLFGKSHHENQILQKNEYYRNFGLVWHSKSFGFINATYRSFPAFKDK